MVNYERLAVYEVNDTFKGLDDGVSLNITSCGLRLLITFSNPSLEEVEAVRHGSAQVKALLKNGMVMFFIKFDGQDWWETTLRIKEESLKEYTPITTDNVGHALHIILADPQTGTVLALRMIGLGNGFSKSLDSMVAQADVTNTSTFISKIKNIQKCYTTNELLKMTNVRYVIGTKNV